MPLTVERDLAIFLFPRDELSATLRHRMRKQLLVIPVVLAALGGVLAWRINVQNRYKHAPSGGSAVVEGVETFVSSRVAGRLTDVMLNAGDKAKQGQLVARIDCVDQRATLDAAQARLLSARATIQAADATVRNAGDNVSVASAQVTAARATELAAGAERSLNERNRDRAATLYDSGAIPQFDLDTVATRLRGTEEQRNAAAANVLGAQNRVNAAKSGVSAAVAQTEAARAALQAAEADVKRAQLNVDECDLVSPRDAYVISRLLEPGAVVAPGSRVYQIVDISIAKITFFLPNAELARANYGAPAEVRVDTYPGRVFTGKIARIASEAEFTPRNVQTREDRDRLVYAVEVQVQNTDGALRPGMPAEVLLPGTER
jgi:HlyD family secretion protein